MNLRQIDPNRSRANSTNTEQQLSRLSEVRFDSGRTHSFLGNIGEPIDYKPFDELSDNNDEEMFSMTSTVNEVERSSLKQSIITFEI